MSATSVSTGSTCLAPRYAAPRFPKSLPANCAASRVCKSACPIESALKSDPMTFPTNSGATLQRSPSSLVSQWSHMVYFTSTSTTTTTTSNPVHLRTLSLPPRPPSTNPPPLIKVSPRASLHLRLYYSNRAIVIGPMFSLFFLITSPLVLLVY